MDMRKEVDAKINFEYFFIDLSYHSHQMEDKLQA